MMIQLHGASIPYVENKTRRVFRLRADECYFKADWFGSDCMDAEQKQIFVGTRVSICVLSKFDDPTIINEVYDGFWDIYKQDSEELYGVFRYVGGDGAHIGLTLLLDLPSLNMCLHGVKNIASGKSPGFILHMATTPDLRWDSRNKKFDFCDFINGQHYFIEDLNYQILKV